MLRVAVTLILCLIASSAWSEARVALVVGNSAYTAVSPLKNPAHDARDMSEALAELGFLVMTRTDQSRTALLATLDEFAGLVQKSDVALFFYAGHAFQIGGQNYLVPTDLVPGNPDTVVSQSLSLSRVMEALDKAPGLKLVFLDACRDNPLGVSGGQQLESGLARIGSAADFLVSYATQPGAVAFDGDGRNGIFTGALLSHIHTSGWSIADLMISVRRDVVARSGGQQIPWDNSSLTRQFQFSPGRETASPDVMFYQLAARSGSETLLALYLDRYPEGAHSDDARARLDQIRSGAADTRLADMKPDELWQIVKRTRHRPLAEYYLEAFPFGPHVSEVRKLTNALPTQSELGPGALCERLATHPRDATGATPGVSQADLGRNAALAIDVCTAAVEEFPEQPKYLSLLARSQASVGQGDDAVQNWQDAAAKGDLRAIVSLANLKYAGRWLPEDKLGALDLYRRAAEAGSTDGANNLAVELLTGKLVDRDDARAIELLTSASDDGSGEAAFNLAFLAEEGRHKDPSAALELYLLAAKRGKPEGYREAAAMWDHGIGVAADPNAAADLLLRGLAEDNGRILSEFEAGKRIWSQTTLAAVQARLAKAKLYTGGIDGLLGPGTINALREWRNGGFDVSVLSS